MTSLNRSTGAPITGMAEIAQSIGDILSTPIGTRICRRDYGCDLTELLDMPMNDAVAALIRAASASAIRRWEPRIRITRIGLDLTTPSAPKVLTEGRRIDLPTPAPFSLLVSV